MVNVPNSLDLSEYKAKGPQNNDNVIDDEEPGFIPNDSMLAQLVSMGMGTQNAMIRALKATDNASAEIALNWFIQHMGDPDINDPIIENNNANSNNSIDMQAVQTLVEVSGCSLIQAKTAIDKYNDVNEATMAIFSGQINQEMIETYQKKEAEEQNVHLFYYL